MTTHKTMLLIGALCLALSGLSMAAGNPAAGQAKSQACVSCHGTAGISPNPVIPHLAGQYAGYIMQQMKFLHENKRADELMGGVAALMADQQALEDIAAYYQSLPRNRGAGRIKSGLGKEGGEIYNDTLKCFECHGPAGEGNASGVNQSPLIAGLGKEYLIKSMKEYRNGTRQSRNGYMMNMVSMMMTDQDIEAIAEYLSNL